LLQIDKTIYHFYPSDTRNNVPLSNKVDPNNENKYELKETWHTDGEVGTMDVTQKSTQKYFEDRQNAGYGFSVFEIEISASQKTKLLQAISNSQTTPPDYRTIGVRCQSWGSRMLRSSGILPQGVRRFSWSTVPFSKALYNFGIKNIMETISIKIP
jgi:hypothetical protein